jgi:hypothetical protein
MSDSSKFKGVGKLTQLVEELERQKETRVDACIDTRQLIVSETDAKFLKLQPLEGTQSCEFIETDGVPFRLKALRQIGRKMTPKVPSKFMTQLTEEQPRIGADLLNQLMSESPKRLFVRQLDNKVRAVLSDSYRVIDNYDLVFSALECAKEVDAWVASCTMSEDRMNIKLIAPSLGKALDAGGGRNQMFDVGELGNENWRRQNDIGDLPLDDYITDSGGNMSFPTCTISNSETGSGSTQVSFGLCDSACFNMCVFEKMSRSIHLGTKMEEGIYSEETLAVTSQSIMLKMRDSIKACFNPEVISNFIMKRQEAQDIKIKSPTAAVDNVVKSFSMPDNARDQLLSHFVADYAPTLDGLSQAMARMAQDDEVDAKSSMDYELYAGQLVMQPSLIK